MKRADFSNGLRLLHAIDEHELVGVAPDVAQAFIDDPVRQFIRADDPMQAAVGDAMQKRGLLSQEQSA